MKIVNKREKETLKQAFYIIRKIHYSLTSLKKTKNRKA